MGLHETGPRPASSRHSSGIRVKSGYQTKKGKDPVDIERVDKKLRAYIAWMPMSTTPLNPRTVEKREVVRDLAGKILSADTVEQLQEQFGEAFRDWKRLRMKLSGGASCMLPVSGCTRERARQ